MKNQKSILLTILCLVFVVFAVRATVATDIAKANKSGKAVFLIITDSSVKSLDNIRKIAEDAQKLQKSSVVIELDRSAEENKDLVAKYRISGAPVPMIMVIASNGAVAGGLIESQATADELVKLIPSKKQAEVLLALNNNKAVLIVCSSSKMTDKSTVVDECKKACTELSDKAATVEIDVTDKNEAAFLKQINASTTEKETVVYIFNAKGQFTSSVKSPVTSKKLVEGVNKKLGGCCPGGSGKKC